MSQTAIEEIRPWEQPFWKPAPRKGAVLFYLVLIHLLAIIGLCLFPLPSPKVLGVALLLAALGGFGITVCYHRLLAHRTLKLNKFVEHFLIFWAMVNSGGSPASWVAYHRHHHSHTDTQEDISSPTQGGFWWAHLRWLYQSAPADEQKWCPELSRGMYKFWTYAHAPVLLLSICCGLVFGWQGFFWIGAIRMVYALHMQCFINSLTHLDHSQERDSSKNVWWLGPLQLTAWGENWHKNHHSNPGLARLGLRWVAARHWLVLDLCSGVGRPRQQCKTTQSTAIDTRSLVLPPSANSVAAYTQQTPHGVGRTPEKRCELNRSMRESPIGMLPGPLAVYGPGGREQH